MSDEQTTNQESLLQKMESEIFLLKLAILSLAEDIQTLGHKQYTQVRIEFDIDKFISGEKLSVVKTNLAHRAMTAFKYNKNDGEILIILPP